MRETAQVCAQVCVFIFGVSRKIIKIFVSIILCVFFSRLKKNSTGKCTLIFRIFGLVRTLFASCEW